MPIAAAIVGSAIIGAGVSVATSNKASKIQKEATDKSIAANERTLNKQIELQEPFRQAGITAQNKILELQGLGGDPTSPEYGSLAKPFGMDQFKADPGYDFRMSEGTKALERSAAARGGLLSGSALKGITRFGQDLASTEYGNAFNRYQIERSARLNPLQSLTGAGLSATNTLTNATGTAGANEQNSIINGGAARASGYIGLGNAINQGIGTIANYYANQPLNNAMVNYYNSGAASGGSVGYGSGAMQGVNGYLAGSPYTASNYGINGFGN